MVKFSLGIFLCIHVCYSTSISRGASRDFTAHGAIRAKVVSAHLEITAHLCFMVAKSNFLIPLRWHTNDKANAVRNYKGGKLDAMVPVCPGSPGTDFLTTKHFKVYVRIRGTFQSGNH